MKKITAFLLATALICALFVIPASAGSNETQDFPFAETAPTVDGEVKSGEYVDAFPIHAFDGTSPEIADYQQHNQSNDWNYEFYACWTETDLHMAWVVDSPVFGPLPEQYYTETGNMWMYSCVQFILTPGAPDNEIVQYQTSQWSGDYLEGGLCLNEDGESVKIAWSKPAAVSAFLSPEDWDCAIVRDGNVTTYEVRIPWNKTGVQAIGNEATFGLTYAVAGQEAHADAGGVSMMLEWPDACLGGKNADNAAVITLTGHEEMDITSVEVDTSVALEDGTLPSDYDQDTAITIGLDTVNLAIVTDSCTLITDVANLGNYNTNWAMNVLLAPTDTANVYKVVEVLQGQGDTVAFVSEITEGMIVLSAHADDETTDAGIRKTIVSSLVVDTELHVFGVDIAAGEQTFKNAMLYTVAESGGDTESDVVSDDESDVVSEDDSSVVSEDDNDSKPATSTAVSDVDDGKDDGSLTWLWIVIAVVAVAAVVVVVIIIKKKK